MVISCMFFAGLGTCSWLPKWISGTVCGSARRCHDHSMLVATRLHLAGALTMFATWVKVLA